VVVGGDEGAGEFGGGLVAMLWVFGQSVGDDIAEGGRDACPGLGGSWRRS
jgi:hypothetical protein